MTLAALRTARTYPFKQRNSLSLHKGDELDCDEAEVGPKMQLSLAVLRTELSAASLMNSLRWSETPFASDF